MPTRVPPARQRGDRAGRPPPQRRRPPTSRHWPAAPRDRSHQPLPRRTSWGPPTPRADRRRAQAPLAPQAAWPSPSVAPKPERAEGPGQARGRTRTDGAMSSRHPSEQHPRPIGVHRQIDFVDEPRKRDTEHLVFKPQPEKRRGKGEAPAIALIGACPPLNRYLDCQVGSTQSLLQLAFHKSGHLGRPLARIGRRSIGADGLTGQLVKSRACLEKTTARSRR